MVWVKRWSTCPRYTQFESNLWLFAACHPAFCRLSALLLIFVVLSKKTATPVIPHIFCLSFTFDWGTSGSRCYTLCISLWSQSFLRFDLQLQQVMTNINEHESNPEHIHITATSAVNSGCKWKWKGFRWSKIKWVIPVGNHIIVNYVFYRFKHYLISTVSRPVGPSPQMEQAD